VHNAKPKKLRRNMKPIKLKTRRETFFKRCEVKGGFSVCEFLNLPRAPKSKMRTEDPTMTMPERNGMKPGPGELGVPISRRYDP
jgi:hypothetical protein